MQDEFNEDELIKHVAHSQKWSGYSKVSRISTRRISPDIDFLRINEYFKGTVGYEFKLLRFRKDWKRVNEMPIYTGIGEAIQYYRFGVNRSYLVLGLSKEIPTKATGEVVVKIRNLVIPIQAFEEEGKSWLGVCVWFQKSGRFETLLSATKDFPMSEDAKHLKECLLRGEFKYQDRFMSGFHQIKKVQKARR